MKQSGNYHFGAPTYAHMGQPDEHVPKLAKFLGILRQEIEENFGDWRKKPVNYEDLYYVAAQISDDDAGEFENPVILPFVREISPKVESQIKAEPWDIRRNWGVSVLARETVDYISDVVWASLCSKPSRLDHLRMVTGASRDGAITGVDIFTLNHDTVIEQVLREEGLKFIEGLGPQSGELRRWDPTLYDGEAEKVRLLKLHGSVDWFRIRQSEAKQITEFTATLGKTTDFPYLRDGDGRLLEAIARRPLILIGTFNKMLRYTSGVYADVFFRFYRDLEKANALVISGYGFGDKGVNSRIIEWVFGDTSRKVIIVDPCMDGLREQARQAISRAWLRLRNERRLIEIPHGVEETSWEEVRSFLTV